MTTKILNTNEIHALIDRGQDITGLVGESVALTRDGSAYRGACPFHMDHDQSLVVCSERQTFTCRVCGANGDAVEFIMRKLDVSKVDAVEYFNALATSNGHREPSLRLVGRA